MTAEPSFDYAGEYDENWQLPEHLTLAQYKKVIFRPDAHYVDGRIIPRTLGDFTHGQAVGDLIAQLHPTCRALKLSSCISLRLQISPTRIRVCDFVILTAKVPREQVPTVAPLLCVEVLSPGQSPVEELDTLADYLAMGVPNIWLIDPTHRSASTFDATGFHQVDPTNLRISDTPIHLDLSEAFEAIY